MTRRRWIAVGLGAAAALLLLGRAVAAAYVDYQWYDALGAAAVWRTKAAAVVALRGTTGLLAAAFIFLNLYAVRRSIVSLRMPRRMANLEIAEEIPGRYLVGVAVLLALAFGALLALGERHWPLAVLAFGGVPFGESDPFFDLDLGFYAYQLPLEHEMHAWALRVILVTAALAIFLYALTPSLRWERGTLYVSNYVRRHVFALVAALLVMLAWSYRLEAFDLLVDGSGRGGAFSYVDHHANIHVASALAVLATAASALVLWTGWTGQIKAGLIAVLAVLLLSMVLRQVAPAMARRSATTRDPVARERPYLDTRAIFTRRAFGVDALRPADSSLRLASSREAASAVSAWDPPALARAVTRARRSEGVARVVGWETTRGELLAVLPQTPLDASTQPWAVARVRATTADAQGNPVPASASADETVPPQLVADSAAGWLLVADTLQHVAAPSLETTLSRLAHAWSLQNYRLLGGDVPQPNPRIVTERGVRQRVARLAPFLEQGSAVTPLVQADTIFWVLDLYVTAPCYPVSERETFAGDEQGYVRHAATAIVNGESGRVTVLEDATRDPMTQTWMRVIPSLFAPPAAVSPVLLDRLPPAVDAAHLQAAALATAGRDVGEARDGHLPHGSGADTAVAGGAEALLVLPRSGEALAWTMPVLDRDERVRGLVIAVGGRRRGAYWLPAAADERWPAISDLLRRFPDTSIALPRDARVIRGAVRAVPVADSLAFIQSVYVVRADGAPALLRVAASTGGAFRAGRSVGEALGVTPAAVGDTLGPVSPAIFPDRVRALYAQMRAALARADWVAFGRAYEALGQLLARTPARP